MLKIKRKYTMRNIVFRLLGAVAISFYTCFSQAEGVWTLVTDISTLQIDDKIVIVSSVNNRALGTTQNSNNRNAVEITKNTDNTCVINENVQQLTLLQGKKTNTFSFYTGNGYLYAASSSENHLKTEISLSNNSSWSISITSEGIATVVAQGTNKNNELKYNSDSRLFSCYSNSNYQADVSLYKYSEAQSQPTTIQINDNGQITEYNSFIGTSLSLPAEASIIDGLEFMGWSREPIVAGVAVADDAIRSPGTSVSVEADMTFYAVYAKPIESGEPAYIKVNSEQEDWSGTYLIACESSSKVFNSSLGENDLFAENVSNAVDITIVDGKIALTETNEQYEFVIAKYNDDYSIKSKNGYYIGCKYDGTYVIQKTPYLNNIKIKEDLLEIKSSGYWLFYNNNKSQFIYTTSANVRVQLYKRVETIKSYAFYTTSPNTEIRINKYGYSTWYSGMPVTVPAGMKAYYCTTEGYTVLLNNMGDIIPANTGAVLYAESAINKEGGESFTLAYSNKDASDFTGNQLIGYVQDTEVNKSLP